MSNNHQLVAIPNTISALISKKSLSVAITLIFLLIVEYFIGWNRLFESWSKLTISNIILAFTLIMFSYVLRAFRIFSYFEMKSFREFMLCIKATLNHNFLNNMLPMRSGELSFPVYLYRYFGIGKITSVMTLFYFRILDMHVLFSLFLIIALYLFPDYSIYIQILIFIWILVSCSAFFMRTKLQNIFANSENKPAIFINRCLNSLSDNNRIIIHSYVWTLLNWLVKLSVFSWIFVQFIEIELYKAFAAVIFGDLTSVLPIHGVAGAGTYEAGIVFGMNFFDDEAINVLTAAINLHFVILSSCILGVIVATFIRHKNKKKL